MLEAWIPFYGNGYVKIFLSEISPSAYGEELASLHQASTIKKGVLQTYDRHILVTSKWNAHAKGMTLKGFPFYLSQGCFWRLEYRFDNHTIKRGSQVISLITSFVEISN
jgi:hypothetical protein